MQQWHKAQRQHNNLYLFLLLLHSLYGFCTKHIQRLFWLRILCEKNHLFGQNLQKKIYRKFPKHSDTQKICCNHSKIWTMWLYHRVMSPNDADGMANSVDSDQTAPQSDLGLHCLPRPVRKLRIITVFPMNDLCLIPILSTYLHGIFLPFDRFQCQRFIAIK